MRREHKERGKVDTVFWKNFLLRLERVKNEKQPGQENKRLSSEACKPHNDGRRSEMHELRNYDPWCKPVVIELTVK
jgi:hypothetical protein